MPLLGGARVRAGGYHQKRRRQECCIHKFHLREPRRSQEKEKQVFFSTRDPAEIPAEIGGAQCLEIFDC
ncbi:hypothetical protein HNY73_006523 [Argiope bruennichi]|uniref:Uncharacterized protein n=1 Tax=Argiope bruennichi TaxID=94029 RepID=A0A8T0FE20_ARGBR|nr:hypothetical protein HNY73_006523 [Argiope bruennichi]